MGTMVASVLSAAFAWTFRLGRDDAESSCGEQTEPVLKDCNLLSYDAMEELILASPEDEKLFLGYLRKADLEGEMDRMKFALIRNPRACVSHCALGVAAYLLKGGSVGNLAASDVIYLAKQRGRAGRIDEAIRLYQIIGITWPDSPEHTQASILMEELTLQQAA